MRCPRCGSPETIRTEVVMTGDIIGETITWTCSTCDVEDYVDLLDMLDPGDHALARP